MATKESKEIMKREPMRALPSFEEFERRVNEMERRFEDFFRWPISMLGPLWKTGSPLLEKGMIMPMIDVFEEKDDVIVKAELPGMSKEDISVDFSDGIMTISGEKKFEEKVERQNYHTMERSYGSFSRSISMPADVQTDKAKARFKDGILEVRVPKTEEAKKKQKKIPVE